MLRYMPRCRIGEGRIRALLEEPTKGQKKGSKKMGHNDITCKRSHGGQTQKGLMVTRKVEAPMDWRS